MTRREAFARISGAITGAAAVPLIYDHNRSTKRGVEVLLFDADKRPHVMDERDYERLMARLLAELPRATRRYGLGGKSTQILL